MDEPFELPLTYKDKELHFPAQLLHYGYTHQFEVAINGVMVRFEPDEERNYRAMMDPEEVEGSKIDIALLQAIAAAIENITK